MTLPQDTAPHSTAPHSTAPRPKAPRHAAARTSGSGGVSHSLASIGALFSQALAVVAPVECAGCGRLDVALCGHCRGALDESLGDRSTLVLPAARYASESGGCRLWFATDYAGVVTALIHSLKEAGRVDVARALAPALARAVVAALDSTGAVMPPTARLVLVAAPSSRSSVRRRGYRHVEEILSRARARIRADWPECNGRSLSVSRGALRPPRNVRDQVGLSRPERWANLSHRVVATRRLSGSYVVVVDDIVTTGATVLECKRAVESVGGTVLGAASVCHTPLN